MQRITPFLWFNANAEEAVNFYVSIFRNSMIGAVTRYGDAMPGPKGSVMTIVFQIEGQSFMALNGGPRFTFTPAISFMVNCETQEELDRLWEKLSEGGEKIECGWLKDKYGVSWQIVPAVVGEMFANADPATLDRVMKAVMQMKKLDIETLKRAYEQK